MERSTKPLLMLVDDNEDDRTLARMALASLPEQPDVVEAGNGEEALSLLKSAERLPSLILLDLKMPVLDGLAVLRRRMSEAELRLIPVVVFSTSSATWDVEESYSLGANAYLVKPTAFEGIRESLHQMLGVFLSLIELPQPRRIPPVA